MFQNEKTTTATTTEVFWGFHFCLNIAYIVSYRTIFVNSFPPIFLNPSSKTMLCVKK